MSHISKKQKLLTLRQASEILGLHPNTLRNWDNDGTLKAVRVGSRGDRRYLKEDVERLLKKQKVSPTSK
jgi:excisionase family DNA binding protein